MLKTTGFYAFFWLPREARGRLCDAAGGPRTFYRKVSTISEVIRPALLPRRGAADRRRLRRGTAAPPPGTCPTFVLGPLWLDLPWFRGAGEEEDLDDIS